MQNIGKVSEKQVCSNRLITTIGIRRENKHAPRRVRPCAQLQKKCKLAEVTKAKTATVELAETRHGRRESAETIIPAVAKS